MKIYRGFRKNNKAYVTVQNESDTEPQVLRHYVKHTPSGFDWGHKGAGPSDLAWALLIDTYGPKAVHFIEFIYQQFKKEVVAELDQQEWTLTSDQVKEAVQAEKEIFDKEFNKQITITSNIESDLSIVATGNIENLIKLSDELKALASQTGLDLTGSLLGDMYYQILQHCENMKQNLTNQIENNKK